ncbi:hypothetical protein QAD02_023351 [Eretmocerus hayati]|uniref:Uncharacterized protein n=1 Tax=Eretmocerus hayati TaxID=131215 RepID=A0ACC2PVY8_9HYME|nr:hypothetical protein QAD02_023351 [Eretmocerus hayati]
MCDKRSISPSSSPSAKQPKIDIDSSEWSRKRSGGAFMPQLHPVNGLRDDLAVPAATNHNNHLPNGHPEPHLTNGFGSITSPSPSPSDEPVVVNRTEEKIPNETIPTTIVPSIPTPVTTVTTSQDDDSMSCTSSTMTNKVSSTSDDNSSIIRVTDDDDDGDQHMTPVFNGSLEGAAAESPTPKMTTQELIDSIEWKEVRIHLDDVKYHPDYDKYLHKRNEYEVERVIKKKFENGCTYYLVKWKNWSSEFNTWEPIRNLNGCDELLKEFEERRRQLIERFQASANYYPDQGDLEIQLHELRSRGKSIGSSLEDVDKVYDRIETYLKLGASKCPKLLEKIKRCICCMNLNESRNEQMQSLQDWEREMNSITKGKPSIKVENTVDLERAPQEFFYIDDYLPGTGVIIPDEPPIGCECTTCDSKTKCCYAMCEGGFPYTSAYRIRVPPGTPIYECNKRCVCPSDCQNRVVQRGSEMKLCVFRTDNGRGWGVKTLRVIKKGTFVIQYVGEVITNEEAERRGKEYDAAGRTYLFDLDYNETEEQCPYTVDAAQYGNISHFINHSCDPNLAVYAVWINCLDPNLPKLALFATRDIKQNEELTFDYMRQSTTTKEESNRQRLDKPEEENAMDTDGAEVKDAEAAAEDEKRKKKLEGRARCKCGADVCRQYLF